MDGQVTWFADAPSSSDLFNYHYPFIQSATLRHNGHQWDDTGNYMTPLMSNGNIEDDLDVDFEKVNYWNLMLQKHVRIKDSNRKTMAQVLADSLE